MTWRAISARPCRDVEAVLSVIHERPVAVILVLQLDQVVAQAVVHRVRDVYAALLRHAADQGLADIAHHVIGCHRMPLSLRNEG